MGQERPPRLSLLLRELPSIPAVLASRLRRARKVDLGLGEGGKLPPVMVLPGLLSSDSTTSFLRRTLEVNGFATYGAKLGFVTGITPEKLAQAEARLAQIFAQHGEKVVLVGWSLGGVFGRVLAQRHPQYVKMVVTLGTPFSGDRHANNAWRVYNALNDHTVDAPSLPDDPSSKPPVHTVAVWSAADGVIAPECARGHPVERDTEHELSANHIGLGCRRAAVEEIAGIVARELAHIDAVQGGSIP